MPGVMHGFGFMWGVTITVPQLNYWPLANNCTLVQDWLVAAPLPSPLSTMLSQPNTVSTEQQPLRHPNSKLYRLATERNCAAQQCCRLHRTAVWSWGGLPARFEGQRNEVESWGQSSLTRRSWHCLLRAVSESIT